MIMPVAAVEKASHMVHAKSRMDPILYMGAKWL